MHFDALCLACIRHELEETLLPGRIQQVVLAGPYSVGLEIYAGRERHNLHLQCDPNDPRVHLTGGKQRRGVETETPLLLLLRKYAREAFLVVVRQPDPAERVLELGIEHRAHGPTTLVVELLGRATNLILRRGQPGEADQAILDCLVRLPPTERARRVLLPGHPYTLPPAMPKLPPLDDGSPDYYVRLGAVTATDGPLWKSLVTRVAGISPAQAREIALRATGKVDAPAETAPLLAVAHALQELWSPVRSGGWQPGLWMDGETPVSYSPYAARSAAEFAPTPSLSAAIDAVAAAELPAVAGSEPGAHDAYAVSRHAVTELLRRAATRIERQLEALARDEPAPGAPEALRTQAEWLLALATRIEPGSVALTVPAEETGGDPLVIPLDPAQTPIEQAERWFDRAAKLERAAEFIPQRRAQLSNDRRYLADLEADLALAQSQPEIAAVRQEIYDGGLLPRPLGRKRERTAKTGGPHRYPVAPYVILAGRNAAQNDRLTFEIAQSGDLWLHVRGAPGSHVVVQRRAPSLPKDGPDAGVPDDIVRLAAQVAGYYSGLRGEQAVDVIVTERRWISRVPGGRPGQVHVRQERTLRVPARLPEGLREE